MWKFHPYYDPTLSKGITILKKFESSLLIRISKKVTAILASWFWGSLLYILLYKYLPPPIVSLATPVNHDLKKKASHRPTLPYDASIQITTFLAE